VRFRRPGPCLEEDEELLFLLPAPQMDGLAGRMNVG